MTSQTANFGQHKKTTHKQDANTHSSFRLDDIGANQNISLFKTGVWLANCAQLGEDAVNKTKHLTLPFCVILVLIIFEFK